MSREFKPMIKMDTTEPSVELKLKKGGSAHHKHHEHEEHHKAGKKVVKKAMGGLPTAGAAVPAPGVTGRRMSPRMAAMMGRGAPMQAPMATPMMKKGGKASEAELKKLHKELMKHEHMKAGKAHHGLKKGGTTTGYEIPADSHKKHGGSTGYAIPADSNKKRGGRMHKFAEGGEVASFAKLGDEMDRFQARSAIEGNAKKFMRTDMHQAVADKAHGTGGVKEKNMGGYKKGGKVQHKEHHPHHEAHEHLMKAHHHMSKHAEGGSTHHHKMMKHHMKKAQECMGYAMGGTIEGNEGTFLNTDMHYAIPDHAHGTGGVEEKNAGGYKMGGQAHRNSGRDISTVTNPQPHEWEFNNIEGTRPGVSGRKTSGVAEGNAGGYKHGGRPVKKHYATGGSVNNTGHAVAMKEGNKPATKHVSIDKLSGTFKKGGKVKKYDDGGSTGTDTPPPDVMDQYQTMKENQGYQNYQQNKAQEKSQPGFLESMWNKLTGSSAPPSGSVTKTVKSVTVTPKKRGGRTC